VSFTDPAINDVASMIHGTCPAHRNCTKNDHLPLARYIVAYFTTANTERRISEAHGLGIKAGSYAMTKTVEKLSGACEQLTEERNLLRTQLDNARGRSKATS
jgi:hypothetical protein